MAEVSPKDYSVQGEIVTKNIFQEHLEVKDNKEGKVYDISVKKSLNFFDQQLEKLLGLFGKKRFVLLRTKEEGQKATNVFANVNSLAKNTFLTNK